MAEAEVIVVTAAVEVECPTFTGTLTVMGDTLVLVEGQGVSSVESAMNGETPIPVISLDTKTLVGVVKFEVPSSAKMIEAVRAIKAAPLGSVFVRSSGTDPAGNRMGRTGLNGTMINDPEKAIQNGGKIPVELHGSPLTPS